MKTVVLAAGISSRLLPLTINKPKPMLPIKDDLPIMQLVIKKLMIQGYHDIIITTHYKADVIMKHFGDGRHFGVNISYSHEADLMDTAGSLKLLENVLVDDFLVCAGSFYLLNTNLKSAESFHRKNGGVGTIVLTKMPADYLKYYGQVLINDTNEIIVFQEKPAIPISSLVHTTYQYYSPKIFKYIQANRKQSIPTDLIPQLLKDEQKLYSFMAPPNDLVNISTVELYNTAKERFASWDEVEGDHI